MRYEELRKGKLTVSPTNSQATGIELKPLPSHLKYAFLGKNETLPVIVNAYLTDLQLKKLLHVLRSRKKAMVGLYLILRELVLHFACIEF